jgi:very-short-patch-repair endonuclease
MVLTHVSAAIERGVPVWGIPLDEVHTTRTDAKSSRREAGVVHHVGVLHENDVEVTHGVRVSKAPRTAIEVSTIVGLEAALVVVNGMLNLGLLTEEELRGEAHRLRYWPETLANHVLLHLVDKRMSSVAETRTDHLFWTQQLPRPEPQVEVRDEFNDLIGIVDFLWREHGVFLEFDGKIKYEKFRRRDESLNDYLRREKLREERICQVTGWICIRISWADLANPAATARRIRRLLESRRSGTPGLTRVP